MARFPTLLDMRQLNAGGGALSSIQNNQALQFSPQMAMTMSNESFLMLDSNPSPSSSMDLGGMNPSLSSNITSEFSSLLESTSQNSFNIGIGSGSSAGMPSQSQGNDILMPADEWSGTTNTQSSGQQQGHQSNSPSQCQSSVSQGQGQGQNAENRKMQQQYGFDKRFWGVANSQNVPELFGIPQQGNRDGIFQGGDNNRDGMLQGGDNQGGRQQQQAFQTGLSKPNFCSTQSSNVMPTVSVSHQVGFQNQAQAGDMHAGFLQQQRFRQAGNVSNISSQELASQEAKGISQPMDFEQNQARHDPNFEGAAKMNMHMNNHGLSQPAVYQRMEVDNHLQSFPGTQPTNQQAMFQRASMNQPQKVGDNHGMQQGELHGDPVMQTIRSLGFQMQGVNPQNAFQTQLQAQYMNLSSQANGHTLSVLLQNQGSAQGQAQRQTLSQPHSQGQATTQHTSVNQQAGYQVRQLQSGALQSPFNTNQQAAFHLGQPQANQVHQHGGNSGSHFAGLQHLNQFQARAQNPVLQGLKGAGRQILQGPPTAALSYAGNNIDGGVRSPMPSQHISRCLHVLTSYMQDQRKRGEQKENNIGFWRDLVHKYFAPGATERWCLSSYSPSQMSRNAQGLFPMEYWFCNLCGVQPGRGFEYSTDVLPRLFKIKYDSGLLDELLCVDLPEESYILPQGKLVLVFLRAVHESIFPELRVVRYGKLRVTFGNNLKILSWEFCAKVHDEVVPRKNLLQQAQQLTNLVMETEQESFDKDAANLKDHCNAFTGCAKQLKSKFDAPNVNDLGFSKRYVRCLQIAEVVNSMKDLISFENKTHLGPIESLARFPTMRKLQSEGLLQQSSVTQLVNQLTQGPGNPNSPYAKMMPRLPLSTGQGIALNQVSSSIIQGNDPSLSKPPLAINQLHVQLRNQARNQNLLQTQAANQMQPPCGSHADTSSQAQAQTSNQLLSQFTPQAHSLLQAQHLGQLQSLVPGQVPSQMLGGQSPNLNHMSQQIYDQGIAKPINFQAPNPVTSHSRSLNRTGQQSLPGTPQSEMSDMRSNT
uniref:TSA: Wollemia nobilis Ref_Wollemi_Transcript_4428_3641 transcribed RNA sequence n=1 Tax=Wollemia nobilis TaxID=56998 RepID=A0A0C9QW91_9CONI